MALLYHECHCFTVSALSATIPGGMEEKHQISLIKLLEHCYIRRTQLIFKLCLVQPAMYRGVAKTTNSQQHHTLELHMSCISLLQILYSDCSLFLDFYLPLG